MAGSPTILVTGGTGYIGSHACKAVAQAGYTPISYDNLVYGHPWAVRWGPLEQGDIDERARLDAVIDLYRPTAVMHFAAYAYVGEFVLDPGNYYRNNVAGTLTLLEAMRDHGIGQFIFSSTCATYGEPQRIPMDESHPQHPINPYGTSKLMIERMLADFATAHGLRWIALRYFNAASADPDGEIGEQHDPETHLIPLVLNAVAGQRPSITLYGDDYATEDGTCIRDYIHVSDLADAHVLALQALGPHRSARLRQYRLQSGQWSGVFGAASHRHGPRNHWPRDTDYPRSQAPRRPAPVDSGRQPGEKESRMATTPPILGCDHRIGLALASQWRKGQRCLYWCVMR